jgi:alpha-glucosidase (family GH31 glycosyl hydrolase)
MATIPAYYKIAFEPLAEPSAIIRRGNARFTVLTSRMIRIEYDTAGKFENRASQAFWYRKQPAPKFSHSNEPGKKLMIQTDDLELAYSDGPFAPETLSVLVKETKVTWKYGDTDQKNLGGTARTLDGINGAIPIGKGLISRDGWSIVDDSRSLVFDEDCWLVDRKARTDILDLYFLGYGHDYNGCMAEYERIAGKVPMLPRWALGNWWSRYWEYTQEELTGLMDDFQRHEVPLGVCIIDMDWHITKTGNKSSGWTGYTWNRDLFRDPEEQLKFLHSKGLKVALNLHPADGVHPHEEMYAKMARRMGIDPGTEEPVEFDIANPDFVNAYFDILHHPQEEKGIDFWWMDWQQGTESKMQGLDPLWWLNHLHFYDLGRDGKRRSFVFSRWGGIGNHRYPIGFSGDTVVSWESLAFQPYFTATAANVNYGWWSHDIGGHMRGIEDGELYTRWVQYGVFSPILRLHSTNNPFSERRPWGYDAEVFKVARAALQMRHAMIPYLYSMGWRYRSEAVAPIEPMYYAYPEREEAYNCPNQYLFGSELLVAPFTSPKDATTDLSRQVVWLPDGNWVNFWNGTYYGNGWHAIYGGLDEVPVYARAGAIVPLGPRPTWGGLGNPEKLEIIVFPGADGKFTLYEDDGDSNAYLNGKYALTTFRTAYSPRKLNFFIDPVEGDLSQAVAKRTYEIKFRGIKPVSEVEVMLDGRTIPVGFTYDEKNHTMILEGIELGPQERLTIQIRSEEDLQFADDRRLVDAQKLVRTFKMGSIAKYLLWEQLAGIAEDPSSLGAFRMALTEPQTIALMETLLEAGIAQINTTGSELLVLWNNKGNPSVTWTLTGLHPKRGEWETWPIYRSGVVKPFEALRAGEDYDPNVWRLDLQLGNLMDVHLGTTDQVM